MTRDRAREQAEPARISATLTAAIHEVTSARTTEAGRAEVHNVRGTLQSGARTGALVRRTMLQPAARDGGLMSHEFGVAYGAEWLEVALHANGGPADRELYLMHCPAEKCGLFRAGMGRRANERLFVPNPPAGRWTVVADPLLSTGPLTLTLDIADPALGQVVAHDRAIVRRPGDRWTVSLDTVTGRAPAGTDVITRIPVVAAALEIPAWTAPAAPRGGALSFTPSWFPLAWIEASAPVRRPSPQ